MSESVRPQRWQPTRLPHPWDSSSKNTGVGCHFLLQCMKVKCESEVVQLCPTLSDPMDYTHQAPPSMGFARQEYWSGVPLPSPISLLDISKICRNPPYRTKLYSKDDIIEFGKGHHLNTTFNQIYWSCH